MDLEAVREKLAIRYGEKRANHIVVMIMPMIIADFYKMLKAAKPNLPVKEEYHLDDDSGVIEMFGYGVVPGEEPKVMRMCMDHIEFYKWEETK